LPQSTIELRPNSVKDFNRRDRGENQPRQQRKPAAIAYLISAIRGRVQKLMLPFVASGD
jgi:hypothetical protein